MDKAKERMIRVLIVDDVKEMRESLRRILVAYPGMEVIGEACDGEEAILRVHQLKPSVVVMDINMPRLNGIKATARIKQAFPHVVIIGISVYATDDTCQIMRAAGAATVITKEAAVDQLRDEIVESVNRRSTFFH
ncbi:MAG TPA: response regulator transcription factor [Nitrospira sp.]|nr:response regulator transcription factor [Nitrospira sp.]